jgi:hypothetical protein
VPAPCGRGRRYSEGLGGDPHGVLAATVREVFGPHTDPLVHDAVAEGPPAHVLLGQARGALLLALGRGTRDHWELPAVGPVGRECLRHSTVPVVMVPAPDRTDAPPTAVETPGHRHRVAP